MEGKAPQFNAKVAKAELPSEMELITKEERAVETQKAAYLKVHDYRDRIFNEESKTVTMTHILGKMWFLKDDGTLSFLNLRLDLEVAVFYGYGYVGTVTMKKSIFYEGKKVLQVEENKNVTEMEEVEIRTHVFEAVTMFELNTVLNKTFIKIWRNATNSPDGGAKNVTLNGVDEDLKKEDFTNVQSDNAESVAAKMKLKRTLEYTYTNLYIPMVKGNVKPSKNKNVITTSATPKEAIKAELKSDNIDFSKNKNDQGISFN